MTNAQLKQTIKDQATQLRNQNMSYGDIASHFEKLGYKNPQTGKPYGYQTIRNMVNGRADVKKEESAEEAIHVVSPRADTLEAIRKLVAVKDMPVADQLDLVQYLLTRASRVKSFKALTRKENRRGTAVEG